METALDRRLADLITRRRLVTWADLVRLRDEALQRGEARAGSPLAAALVRSGTLSAPQVDELLVAALGQSGESSGARAFFQDPTASLGAHATLAPSPPVADPERTVLDAAAPIPIPPSSGPAGARPPYAGLPPAPAAPARPASGGLPAAAPRPPLTGAPRPALAGPPPPTHAGAAGAPRPAPASSTRPAPGPRAPQPAGAADPDDGARTIAAPPAFVRPAPAPADADDGARTIAAPPAFVRPAPAPADADDGARTIAAPPALGRGPAAADDDDGARTVASPLQSGFGSGPAPAPAAFGDGPAGFGAGPAGFGAGPAGFGAGPAGFGAGPAGFGAGPGVHSGPASVAARTKAGPSEEELIAAASQRLAAVFHGGRFARKDPVGQDGRTRATDQRIRRPVLLALGPPMGHAEAADHPFFREARLLAAVGHPAVPRVHDAGVDAGRAFVAFDLPEGDRLPDALRSKQRPTLPALLRAFLEVTAAVARAHEAGVLHGTLAPQRVLLGAHGRVLVDGWSWARALQGAPAEVDEASALPPPAEEDDPPRRAPEAGRERADARTDVFGLGLILERMLAGGAPGPLRAIARKALQPIPASRYLTVRALQEDVRRYLDGRSVSAEAESLVGAALRLGRKHPAAAAVGGVLALLLVGLGALTASQVVAAQAEVRLADARVEEQEAKARTANEEAGRREGDARAVQALAASLATIEDARAAARRAWRDQPTIPGDRDEPRVRDALRKADRRVEDGLRTALGKAVESQAALRAVETSGVAGAKELAPIGGELARAVGLARLALAQFFLREANRTRPDLALAEYRNLATEPGIGDGLRAEGLLGAYLAARRLAGEAAAGEEAIVALARIAGPVGALGRAVPLVREAEALREARREIPDLKRREEEVEATLGGSLERPLANELWGRMPSAHRYGYELVVGLLHGSMLDPTDPGPAIEAMRLQSVQSGLQPLWRWSTGNNLQLTLERASRKGLDGSTCVLDPRPLLDAASYLQRVERKAASRPLLEQVVRELEPLAPRRPEVQPALVRARLLLARARLADGREPGLDLDELEVPPGRDVERHALRFWSALRSNDPDRALATTRDVFPLLRAPPGPDGRPTPEVVAAFDDLADSLLDPLVTPATVLAVTGPILASGGPAEFNLARARAALDLGRDPGPDLDRFGGRVKPTLDMLGATLFARTYHLRQRGHPEAHAFALRIWSQVNQTSFASEQSAVAAQAAIVERLRDLGRHDAADAFERVPVVDELFVLPVWLPPEGAVWRRP